MIYEARVWVSGTEKKTFHFDCNDHRQATDRARKRGRVVSCRKWDGTYQAETIEHLDLKPEPAIDISEFLRK